MNPEFSNKEKNEVFISCVSYEYRSMSILEFFDDKTIFKKGILFVNEEVLIFKSVKNKISEISTKYKRFFEEYNIITIPKELTIHETAVFIRNNINENLKYLQADLITIEISTFKRFELVFLLHFLNFLNIRLRFFYLCPVDYGNWLSEEFTESRTLPILVNKHYDNRKDTFLLVILGYEIDRALKLIDDLIPVKAIIGRANPPTAKKHGIIQVEKIKNSLKFLFNNFVEEKIIDLHGYDLRKFNLQVEELLNKYSKDYNIFIASMGPKCHILSLYQLYNERKNFNFYYNGAMLYNYENYTSGIEKIFEFTFDDKYEYLNFDEYTPSS